MADASSIFDAEKALKRMTPTAFLDKELCNAARAIENIVQISNSTVTLTMLATSRENLERAKEKAVVGLRRLRSENQSLGVAVHGITDFIRPAVALGIKLESDLGTNVQEIKALVKKHAQRDAANAVDALRRGGIPDYDHVVCWVSLILNAISHETVTLDDLDIDVEFLRSCILVESEGLIRSS